MTINRYSLAIYSCLIALSSAVPLPRSMEEEPDELGTKSNDLFHVPTRLKADGQFIRTEAPGYASPAWFDIDSDGRRDLIVGQFRGGKMKVYRNLGDAKFAKGEWLKASGAVATVPGIW